MYGERNRQVRGCVLLSIKTFLPENEKEKPRHEAFYRLQRKKTGDLEKFTAKIKARIKEMQKRHKSGDDTVVRLIIESENRLMLSEIRKIETKEARRKNKKWGSIAPIKIEDTEDWDYERDEPIKKIEGAKA